MADAAYLDHCRELLQGIGPVDIRRMFGGHGIYAGDVMFALIARDTLYLRIDDTVRDAFADAGSEPFVYDGKAAGRPVTMPYMTAPEEAMDDPAAMTPWAEQALAAARRTRTAKAQATRARRN